MHSRTDISFEKTISTIIPMEFPRYSCLHSPPIVDGLRLPNPVRHRLRPSRDEPQCHSSGFSRRLGRGHRQDDQPRCIQGRQRHAALREALRERSRREIVGWENIELISDRPFEIWLEEFKRCKDQHPTAFSSPPSWRSIDRDAWFEIVERCQDAGVDGFELNFSCPHGLPERKMGSAMGEDPEILLEVCGWVMSAAKRPVWAKMTPNITHIEDPARAALKAGVHGISAINTIRCVIGVNLETLRPEPTVEGYTTPGGYSSKAVRPIALRMCMELATMIRNEFPGRSLSGIGGVETGEDAAQFILLGADTVQVCTGVMKFGYELVKPLCEGSARFHGETQV